MSILLGDLELPWEADRRRCWCTKSSLKMESSADSSSTGSRSSSSSSSSGVLQLRCFSETEEVLSFGAAAGAADAD